MVAQPAKQASTSARLAVVRNNRPYYSQRSCCLLKRGRSRSRHRDRSRFQIFGIPGQVALEAVLLKTRPRDAVKLAGINHQLCWYAEAAQRLVHLFAAEERHIEIPIPAEE